MELFAQTVPAVSAIKHYSGTKTLTAEAGKKLNIETNPDKCPAGKKLKIEIDPEKCPDGKVWEVHVSISITETDA